MNVMPVAAFLKDFSDCLPPEQPLARSPEEEAEERAQLAEAARAEGFEAGRAEALAEAEAQLAQRDAEFQQQLVAAREAWAASEATALADAMNAAIERARDEIIAVTAHVLKPFLIEQVRDKALAELSRTIEDVLRREPDAPIAISGPADLLKALEFRLSEHAGAMTFTPSSSCEVEVTAGHALLSTRLAAWVEKLNEACP